MVKPVPDPPALLSTLTTAHTHFADCNGIHPPLFAVCEGASLEDALVHLSTSLKSAYETNFQVCESADLRMRGLAWATQHSLEIGLALLDSLLKGCLKKDAGVAGAAMD
ncbi:hypothetical protein V0R50_15975 [Pseudomonas sp. 148P]|uniref:DUF3077 domain-containing protein n=1 Tax=Pseudomonas ulcerans TaxID=3115852 RepID=A0ABU7HTE7_9PSED|nr:MULTISPECIES: hypothetical protein [unclassified Pseudomonas]MEE1924955.1 hypothetical protein [Pseudomonas sp. 147P]MEE1934728.1 hypothetical protein [Pseudomonas sp. 148P]